MMVVTIATCEIPSVGVSILGRLIWNVLMSLPGFPTVSVPFTVIVAVPSAQAVVMVAW